MLLLAIPVFTVLFFAPRIVISTLFGMKYSDGYIVLRILLLGKLFSVFAGLNTSALIALGENKTVSYLVFIEVGVNLIANIILIPIYGIEGGAIALTASLVLGDILGVIILYRNYNVHPVSGTILYPLIVLGILAGIAYGVFTVIGVPDWAVIPVIGISYPVVVTHLALEEQDEELLTLLEDRIGIELTIVRKVVDRLQ
jgi:O-antigen/teichoic acid export membrane protein